MGLLDFFEDAVEMIGLDTPSLIMIRSGRKRTSGVGVPICLTKASGMLPTSLARTASSLAANSGGSVISDHNFCCLRNLGQHHVVPGYCW